MQLVLLILGDVVGVLDVELDLQFILSELFYRPSEVEILGVCIVTGSKLQLKSGFDVKVLVPILSQISFDFKSSSLVFSIVEYRLLILISLVTRLLLEFVSNLSL